MAGPSITTKFLADTSRMTGDVDKATSGMGGSIKNFAKGAAVALGGAFAVDKVIDFTKQSINAASDLNESMSKVGVVFGSASKSVVDWSQNAATSMGMSQQAALEAAGTYGNLAVSMGLPQTQAADMSKSLVGLAADLGSFNNVPVDEALQALQSGLTGETEPLKKFGINLNEAALKAQAMAMGLSDGKAPLSAAAKAQAAYALIMQQSTTAQGDFARTSDGLANSTKTSAAQFEDMKAKIGDVLLPVMTTIVGFISSSLIPAFEAIGSWIADHQDIMLALGVGLAAAGVAIMVTLVPAFIAWAAAAGAAAIATIAAAAPFVLIGVAVAALAYLIINNWDTIKSALMAAFDAIKTAVNAVWQAIQTAWNAILSASSAAWGAVASVVGGIWNGIKAAATAVWQWVVGKWDAISSGISSAVSAISSVIGTLVGVLKLPMQAAAEVFNFVKGRFDAMVDAIRNVIGGISSAIGSIVDAIKRPINAIIGAWNGLEFKIPTISIPSVDIPGIGTIGGGSFGGQTFGFPDIPKLATGGVLTSPTLFLGGEAGTEIVAPEAMLRAIMREEGGGRYELNIYPRTADSSDIAYGFRRLELLAGVQ